MLFHDQKLEKISQLLELRPYWKSKNLAEKLGISKSTVQRCLQELNDTGLAERIHGGVRRKDYQQTAPVTVEERMAKDFDAKEIIAKQAIKLIPKSGYVYLDAGTTILPLSWELPAIVISNSSNLIFVTNDVSIATVLAKGHIKHILLSGQMHPVTQSISGPLSQSQIHNYNFEACFISVNGIDTDSTVTCSIIDESLLKREVIQHSKRKYLLSAYSNWGKQAGAVITKLSRFDVLVSERSDPKLKKICKSQGVDLLLAGRKSI
jgi:DeoR family fructose operon transcriptional repressor